jgi:hypothetical protein
MAIPASTPSTTRSDTTTTGILSFLATAETALRSTEMQATEPQIKASIYELTTGITQLSAKLKAESTFGGTAA